MAAPQASSRLEMLQARFQQKQLQEKEQKLLQLYDQQQQRAYQVVQRGSAGSNGSNHSSSVTHQTVTRTSSNSHTTSTSQGGKVRQMFDERRQTTVKGIDRSYPLEPLENKPRKQTSGNGVVVPSQKNGNLTVSRQSVIVKRVGRADLNSNLNAGKPVVSYHEEITRESFGPQLRQQEQENQDENEFGNENYGTQHTNGNIPHDDHHQILDQDTIDNNRMMAKLHLMEFDETMKHRIRNDLESEEFPEELMVEVPDKLPKRTATKKLSQAEARLERFKNANARRSNVTKNTTSTTVNAKKRSETVNSLKITHGISEAPKARTDARKRHVRRVHEEKQVQRDSEKSAGGMHSPGFRESLQKAREESSELKTPAINKELNAELIKPSRLKSIIKNKGKGNEDPKLFFAESEKSALKFSLKPEAVVESAAHSAGSRGKRVESMRENSRPMTEIAKAGSRNIALMKNGFVKNDRREKSATIFSSQPSYGKTTALRYTTTNSSKNGPVKLFNGDSKPVMLSSKRNNVKSTTPDSRYVSRDSPEFFCVESEKSATTYHLPPMKPTQDDTKTVKLFKQRPMRLTENAKTKPRINTVASPDYARSSRRNSSNNERGNTDPKFFCVESKKSATTFSLKPETDGALLRENGVVRNGERTTKVSEAEFRKLDIIRKIRESSKSPVGAFMRNAKEGNGVLKFHSVNPDKSPTSFSSDLKTSPAPSPCLKKVTVRNDEQTAAPSGKNGSTSFKRELDFLTPVHVTNYKGENDKPQLFSAESKKSVTRFNGKPEIIRTPSPCCNKGGARDKSSPKFSEKRLGKLFTNERVDEIATRPFTPDSLKSDKPGSSSPVFSSIESDRSVTSFRWRPETKTLPPAYTYNPIKSGRLSELFRKPSEKPSGSLAFGKSNGRLTSPETFRRPTKKMDRTSQFYLQEKNSVAKYDKSESEKSESPRSTRKCFEKRKTTEQRQVSNKESPSTGSVIRKPSRSVENLLRSIEVIRDIIKRQSNAKDVCLKKQAKENEGLDFNSGSERVYTNESEMINRRKRREGGMRTRTAGAMGKSIIPSDKSYELSTAESSPKSCLSITEIDTEVHEITIPDQYLKQEKELAGRTNTIISNTEGGKFCPKRENEKQRENMNEKEDALSNYYPSDGKIKEAKTRGTISLKKADTGSTYVKVRKAVINNEEKKRGINIPTHVTQKAPKKRGSLLESNIFVPMVIERRIRETKSLPTASKLKQNRNEDLGMEKDASNNLSLKEAAHSRRGVEEAFSIRSSSPRNGSSLPDSGRRPGGKSPVSEERVTKGDLLRPRKQGASSFSDKQKMTEPAKMYSREAGKSYRGKNPAGWTLTSRRRIRPGEESSSETDGGQVLRSTELVRRALQKRAGTVEESTQSSRKKIAPAGKGIGSAEPREETENVNQKENNVDPEAAGKYDTADSCRLGGRSYIKTIKRTAQPPRRNKFAVRGAKDDGIKTKSIANVERRFGKEKDSLSMRTSEPRRYQKPGLDKIKDSLLSNGTRTKKSLKEPENIKRITFNKPRREGAKEIATHKNESSGKSNFTTGPQAIKSEYPGETGMYNEETHEVVKKQKAVYTSSEETFESKTVEMKRYETISKTESNASKHRTTTYSELSADGYHPAEKLAKYEREEGSHNKVREEIFNKSMGKEVGVAESKILSVKEYERSDSVESALKRFDSIGAESEYRETSKTQVTELYSLESCPETVPKLLRERAEQPSYKCTVGKDDSLDDTRKARSDVGPVSLKTLDETPGKDFSENYGVAGPNSILKKTSPKSRRVLKIPETPNSTRETKRTSRVQEIRTQKRIANAKDSMKITRSAMKPKSPSCKRRLFQNSDLQADSEETHKSECAESLLSPKRNKTESAIFVKSFASFSSCTTSEKAVKRIKLPDKVVAGKKATRKSISSSLPPVRQLRSIEDIRKSIRKTSSNYNDYHPRTNATISVKPVSKSAIANGGSKQSDKPEMEKQQRGRVASEFRSLNGDSQASWQPRHSFLKSVPRLSRIAKSPSPDPVVKKSADTTSRATRRRSVPLSPSSSPDTTPRQTSSDMKTQETKASRCPMPTKPAEAGSKKTTINRKSTNAVNGVVLENGLHPREQVVEGKQDNSPTPKKADAFMVEFEDGISKEGYVVPPKKPLLRKQSGEKQTSPTHSTRPVSSISSVSSGSSAQGQTSGPKGKMATRAKTPISGTSSSKAFASGKGAGSANAADNLVPCKVCGRRFAHERITLHEQICTRTAQKKRKQFDTMMYRVKGTDLEPFVKKGIAKKQPESKPKKPEVKSNWRRKHEDFINAIRSAKQVQAHLAAGGKLSDLPPPPASDTSDYIQCPHCGRKFNQAAAERHIPKCEHMLHNKPVHSRAPRLKR